MTAEAIITSTGPVATNVETRWGKLVCRYGDGIEKSHERQIDLYAEIFAQFQSAFEFQGISYTPQEFRKWIEEPFCEGKSTIRPDIYILTMDEEMFFSIWGENGDDEDDEDLGAIYPHDLKV